MKQMFALPAAPRLLIFDSGLGGLSVLAAIRRTVPGADLHYVADDAGFPYGELEEGMLLARVGAVISRAIELFSPDAVVIACNTASTVVLPELRARMTVPFIGTVPAIKPAAAMSGTRRVSVLATPGTVARDYTRALIHEHGGDCRFTLVGSRHLARLAEQRLADQTVGDNAIAKEIAPCFVEEHGLRTDVIVLACTHYPLLLDRFERLAQWPLTWLDPAPAIARQTRRVLDQIGFANTRNAAAGPGSFSFTSGRAVAPALGTTLATYGLSPLHADFGHESGAPTPLHHGAPQHHEGLKP